MDLAESLYQRGYLSYPRTETDKFKEGTDLQGLIRAQLVDGRWGGFAQGLLSGGFQWPRDGGHDDSAHPPIHPVKAGNDLQGDEARLYEFVARRFLACCARDAIGFETVVTVDMAGERFTTSGLMIREKNYLLVYTYDRWNAKTVPSYHDGEQFTPSSLLMSQGSTSAPSPLTESDLIGLMDDHGIGTDATIAEHIKKVQERQYTEKLNDYFYPTRVGKMLLSGYVKMGFDLGKPELRAEMERDMNKVRGLRRTRGAGMETGTGAGLGRGLGLARGGGSPRYVMSLLVSSWLPSVSSWLPSVSSWLPSVCHVSSRFVMVPLGFVMAPLGLSCLLSFRHGSPRFRHGSPRFRHGSPRFGLPAAVSLGACAS